MKCKVEECIKQKYKNGYCNAHNLRIKRYGRLNKIRAWDSHGMSNHELRIAWTNMKQRCENPNHKQYPNYGGRGIKVCDEWSSSLPNFIKYIESLENYMKEGYSIDRIDNSGNYEPGNIRWANRIQQANNKRIPSNSTLRIPGIYYSNRYNKYIIEKWRNGKRHYIGSAYSLDDAKKILDDFMASVPLET